ncbi:MAG TPA: K(+)-transporting ATPase subunit C [Ilumatobacteraceae bacterium]|nr:K(+)-transporting ATPase subunit C [Ilumatobacteraceae bacterium]
MRALIRQLRPALLTVIVFTLICGVAYPLLSTAIGQVAFGNKANGSLIKRDGVVVGSKLIGQTFTDPKYFAPRPSAAGAGYDGSASSGSNLGPTSPDLLSAVKDRVAAYRQENGLAADALVPVDAVTASASGLDPHISVANARLQAPRVAKARGLDPAVVAKLVVKYTDGRQLWVLGGPGVNVVELNLALDDLAA